MLSVSMLTAHFGHLEKDCTLINESAADWFHLDVMDGVFVPNISFGFPVIEAIAHCAQKPLDTHLMIVNPSAFYPQCAKLGISWLTVHYEACPHLNRDLQTIRLLGMKAGVAINPATPVAMLEDAVDYADMVLIMSVNPGFGGQRFIPESLRRIEQLAALRQRRGLTFKIQVDGGISEKNAAQLYQCGADVLVAGNAIFSSEHPKETIARIAR